MGVNIATSAGTNRMKIAMPMVAGKFCDHFGGASDFLIYEGLPSAAFIGTPQLLAAPEHQPGALPKRLIDREIDAVVVSAIGQRALFMLADAGIETFLADAERDPAKLAVACLQGKLVRANQENSRCDGSHHHDKDEHDCDHHGKNA